MSKQAEEIKPNSIEKPCITWEQVRWLICLCVAFLGWLFVLNAEDKLTIEVAINYTVFIMAFLGLAVSLIACLLSYLAYLDSKRGLDRVMDKLDALPDKITKYQDFKPNTSMLINWKPKEKKE